MNLQKILCLAITAVVSSHALALEIYQGRVINEKTWSTDGGKVSLVKHKLPRMMANNGNPQFQDINVYIASDTTKVGRPVTLNNVSIVSVRNDTATNKTYTVMHSVCANISDKTMHCVYHQQDLELDSNGYFSDDTAPQLTLSFDKPGIYAISASTDLFDKEKGYGIQARGSARSDIVVS